MARPSGRRAAGAFLRGLAAACLAGAAGLLPAGCHEQGVAPEEKYVTVRLHDSLGRYDSVEVIILAAGDTSQVVARAWAGPLPDPSALPSYRLAPGEQRPLAIRVRAYDEAGRLALDQIISKEGGASKVASLLPVLPVDTSRPVDTAKPVDTTKPPDTTKTPVTPRPPPSTRLKALSIQPGALDPAFDSSITEYAASFAHEQATLKVTAVPVVDSAGLRVEGEKMRAGEPSHPIPLRVGQNEITLRVSAGDGVRIYTLRVVRASQPPPADTVKPDTSGFAAWKRKTTVDVNVMSLGMGPGVVRDFPLLVRFKYSNFDFAETMPDGRDLRFVRNGVALKHELARWDIVNEVGEAWVLIDSLRTDSAFKPLELYWGNPLARDVSDPAGTFSTAAGFNAVWHLAETGKGEQGEYREATGRYHGTAGGPAYPDVSVAPRPPRRVEGVVGYGQNFRYGGKPGDIVVPPAFDPGLTWTFQTWVKTEGTGTLFQKGEAWQASRQRFELQALDAGRRLWLKREGNDYATNIYLPQSAWLHLTVVNDGVFVHFYVDGFLRESKQWSQGSGTGGYFVIGSFSTGSQNTNFNGSLDEIWFSTQSRSATWIRLAFENQRPEAFLVTVKPR